MPWVNIFENEDCVVVVGLMQTGNQYPPDPGDVFPIDRDFKNNNPQYFGESFVGLYYNELNIVGPAIGVPPDTWSETLPWGMYIIPSGGIAGRRFRARVLQQTSGLSGVGPDEGLIQCPGYFVNGCGWMPAYDEAALVPYNESGNPPIDSEWYEFEVVADKPDAGGMDSTGWVGLFNFDNFGWHTDIARGFFEWQVWVDDPKPSTGRPWWLCVRPDPPEPCPVRVNPAEEFVPFDVYDADFKFPLASSRKPMKIKRPTDCIVCAPTLIDKVPPEPPPPECEFPSAWNVLRSPDGSKYAIMVNGEPITYDNYQDLLPDNAFYITDAGPGQPGNEVMMWLRWGYFDPEEVGNFLFWLDEPFLGYMAVPFEQWACLRGYRSYGERWFQDPVGVINCCEERPLCVELHHQSGSGNNDLIYEYEINGLPDWFVWGNDFEIVYGDYGSGFFVYNSEYNRYENQFDSIRGPLEGTDGTLLQMDPNNDGGVLSACVNWSIPVGI